MTDIPETDTLKGLLDAATPGPWQISGGRGPERSLYGHDVGPDGKPVALVDYPPPGRRVADDIHFQCRANASLIALAPSLAARVIEQGTEIARLRIALHEARDEARRMDLARDHFLDQRNKLQEALRFYSDVSKYPAPLTGGAGALWSDCGQVARAALEDGQ